MVARATSCEGNMILSLNKCMAKKRHPPQCLADEQGPCLSLLMFEGDHGWSQE